METRRWGNALVCLLLLAGCRRPPVVVADGGIAVDDAPADAGPVVPTDDNDDEDLDPDCVRELGTERAPTEAESAATFGDLGLPGFFACAGCHQGGSPGGAGMSWGPSGASWHEASVALAQRETVGTPPNSTSLFLHFTALNTSHPGVAPAADAVLSWLAYRDSTVLDVPPGACASGEGEGEGEPVVVDCAPLPVSESASRAKWSELSMGANFSCAGCHSALGTPTGRGQEWGPGDADWWTAAATLVDGQASLEPTSTSLYLHFTDHFSRFHEDGTEEERTRTLAWITFHRAGPLPTGCN